MSSTMTMRRRGGGTSSTTSMMDDVPSTSPRIKRTNRRKSSPKTILGVAIAVVVLGCIVIISMFSDNGSSITGNEESNNENKGTLRQVKESSLPISSSGSSSLSNGVILHTKLGDIRIHFTPEWAGGGSIQYIENVVRAVTAGDNGGKCDECKFYRVENQLLLQGIIAQKPIPKNEELGPCPKDAKPKPNGKVHCPPNDPHCACHGPLMTTGMVGWAHGKGGPDFFITTSESPLLLSSDKPVEWWEHQHTVWGHVRDEASLKVVESSYDLPIDIQRTIKTGVKTMKEEVEFSLELF